MRKMLFLIIKLSSRFLNKLMISRYTTMFYNNVMLYCKALFWLKTCKKTNKTSIQDQAKQTGKSSRLPITERRLHILESAYIYCVYIVSRINSERNNNIHMLGWKFVPQSDNKNALTKITCANSFLALCVRPLSLEETLYRLCLKIISVSDALSSRLNQSTAGLTWCRECSDGQLSFLSRLCLDFMWFLIVVVTW